MLATMRSQITHVYEDSSMNMEGRFAEMEECMRKMPEEVENLRRESEVLKRKNSEP